MEFWFIVRTDRFENSAFSKKRVSFSNPRRFKKIILSRITMVSNIVSLSFFFFWFNYDFAKEIVGGEKDISLLSSKRIDRIGPGERSIFDILARLLAGFVFCWSRNVVYRLLSIRELGQWRWSDRTRIPPVLFLTTRLSMDVEDNCENYKPRANDSWSVAVIVISFIPWNASISGNVA